MQTEQDNPLIDAIFDNAPEREGVHNDVPKGVAIDLKVRLLPFCALGPRPSLPGSLPLTWSTRASPRPCAYLGAWPLTWRHYFAAAHARCMPQLPAAVPPPANPPSDSAAAADRPPPPSDYYAPSPLTVAPIRACFRSRARGSTCSTAGD